MTSSLQGCRYKLGPHATNLRTTRPAKGLVERRNVKFKIAKLVNVLLDKQMGKCKTNRAVKGQI